MTHRIVSAFVFIVLLAAVGFSQDKPTWITELEKTIAQKEPVWKIGQKNERELGGGSYEYTYNLKSGGGSSLIQISRLYKLPNAAETFAGQVLIFDNTMGKNQTKTKLEGYGDEGFMWSAARKAAWANIQFRKDDVFVRIFAPSAKTAKRFADYVKALLPAD